MWLKRRVLIFRSRIEELLLGGAGVKAAVEWNYDVATSALSQVTVGDVISLYFFLMLLAQLREGNEMQTDAAGKNPSRTVQVLRN